MNATTSLLPAPVVTLEQRDLIRRTIAPDATNDELELFFYDNARQGVHPFDKLIHFTKKGGRYTPITSIDFMRMRAADTGEYAGSDDAVFDGEPKRADFAAHVTVYRLVQGQRCAFTATARWSEYVPDPGPNNRGDLMWRRMPHVMLSKCAEALALRKGFPRQLAGLYAQEEMDQARADTIIDAAVEPQTAANSRRQPQTAAEVDTKPASVPAPVVEQVDKGYSSTQNTKPAVDLPPGTVRIDRVDRNKTKKGNPFALVKIISALGEEQVAQTFDHVLMLECQQFADENVPVLVVIGKPKYGYPQLASAKRFEQALPLDVSLDEPLPDPDEDYPF